MAKVVYMSGVERDMIQTGNTATPTSKHILAVDHTLQ